MIYLSNFLGLNVTIELTNYLLVYYSILCQSYLFFKWLYKWLYKCARRYAHIYNIEFILFINSYSFPFGFVYLYDIEYLHKYRYNYTHMYAIFIGVLLVLWIFLFLCAPNIQYTWFWGINLSVLAQFVFAFCNINQAYVSIYFQI